MSRVLSAAVAAAVLLLVRGPAVAADGDLARWVEQLGSDDAAARKEAMAHLEEAGEPALAPLRRAAKEHPDPDVRLRALLLIRSIDEGPYAELSVITGPTPGYWLNRVAFTADGKQVIATGGAVIWYDPEQGKEVNRVMERQFARRGFALSADGKYFLTGHQTEPTVRLGEVATGREVRTFEGHTKGVNAVALSPGGTLAASGGEDRTVRLWEVKSGRELRKTELSGAVSCLAFSPDGKRLAAGHAEKDTSYLTHIQDAETGKELLTLRGHTAPITVVKFLSDGKSLLTAGMDGKVVQWDAETGKELQTLTHKGGVYDLAVTPDGKRVLSAGWEDHAVRLWDLAKGTELHAFEGHQTRVLGVAVSLDGKRAASSDANCTVRVWRLSK